MTGARLSVAANLADPDAAFRLLVEAHRGLTDEESAALDSALVLLLANHIGDLGVLGEALALARRATRPSSRRLQDAVPVPAPK